MQPPKNCFQATKNTAANIPAERSEEIYTIELFKEDFPQFFYGPDAPEDMWRVFIKQVNDSVLPSRWGSMWRYAAGLYVAHFASIYLRTYNPDTLNGLQSAAASQPVGAVKTAAMGDTSISYDNSSITAGMEKWGEWNATQYGQQLVTMARLVGMGGMYVI